jgi:nucleotide-binding universal stress UspA family protein
MYKTIVSALDGSERSLKALKHACSLAAQYSAKLIVVHAYPHTSDLHDFAGYHKLLATRKNVGEQVLTLADQIIGKVGFDVEKELLEGPAAAAVLTVADTRSADLIVLGTRGMGALQGALFGSVATKVSHHANCPVLVIR